MNPEQRMAYRVGAADAYELGVADAKWAMGVALRSYETKQRIADAIRSKGSTKAEWHELSWLEQRAFLKKAEAVLAAVAEELTW